MKLNVEEFMETEMGIELKATVTAWDRALSKRRKDADGFGFYHWDSICRECLSKWEVFQLAIKQFYGIEFWFTRTDDYFGACTEDESVWLMKVYRKEE